MRLSALLEAVDPDAPARRAAAGHSAGREVQGSVDALDLDATIKLKARLQQLKRELQGILAAAGSDYRRFTAQSLIDSVDRLIADAARDLGTTARGIYTHASALGVSSAEEPIRSARIAVTPAPQVDAPLVTAASELTGDLLTPPMQIFRNQVVQGIRKAAITGGANPYVELAKTIGAEGFDAAAFKAERIVRTELSRVLNQATFARLEGLAKTMPFLRKGWRSSKDSRVRLGHKEAAATYARGSGIPIAEPFQVNTYQELPGKPARLIGTASLRFPVDPDATPAGRVAAGATIMCRCNGFVDFDLEALRAWSTAKKTVVVPEPTPPAPQPIAPEPPKPRKPRAPKPLASAAELRAKVGAIASKYNLQKHTIQNVEIPRAEGDLRRARTNEENLADLDAPMAERQAAVAKIGELTDRLVALRQQLARMDTERLATVRKALEVPASMRVKIPTRFSWIAKQRLSDSVRQKYTAAVKDLERLVGFGKFTATKTYDWQKGSRFTKVTIDLARRAGQFSERAFASEPDNSINMGSNDPARTVVHELGHVLEFNTPEVKKAAFAFLNARTAGEKAELLSKITGDSGYAPHEIARKDKFISPYMGKDYGGQYTEIVSMGLEYLYATPEQFAIEDPDYFDFMVDLVRGRFR